MAPKRGMSVEHTEEYEEFMKKLTEYHEKRGYAFDDVVPYSRQHHGQLTRATS